MQAQVFILIFIIIVENFLTLPLDSFEFFFTDSHQLEKLNTAQASREYRQLRVLYISTMKNLQWLAFIQCCGSGSGFNRVPGSGSGSRRAKMTYRKEKS
jgi:hypothetical protein